MTARPATLRTLEDAGRALLEAAQDPAPAKLARAARLTSRAARALAFAGYRPA